MSECIDTACLQPSDTCLKGSTPHSAPGPSAQPTELRAAGFPSLKKQTLNLPDLPVSHVALPAVFESESQSASTEAAKSSKLVEKTAGSACCLERLEARARDPPTPSPVKHY